MSEKGSVFQKGGGGTNFEQSIQTAFLTTLIIRGNAPCLNTNEIIEVAFQTTNRGYETDDLLVIAKSAIGLHRLLVQVKYNMAFTVDNDIFKEVIKAFWKDYNNLSLFDKEKDKLLIIKSGFTQDERNHLKSLLNWAKTHATETDFITEVNRIKGKKDRLEVFRESLKIANNNIPLTDKEVWEFLKTFDILEYDFTNQNSVDEVYFHNLIKLCKSKETSSNEKEIWNSISAFVSKLNKDGGSVTVNSIQKEELYEYFDTQKLNPYFKAVNKLKSDGEVIIKPLKNTIGNLHIERKDIDQAVVDSINRFQFTIVTGKPGVGKSAEIKDVLTNEFSSASVFVFRADQFNEPHLANVFSSQGVNETIQDIFSCISLIPDKIIFIDSLEKLLEANPDFAFKQLLSLLKDYPDIKIIGSSRKYAIDLIIQKFEIDKKELSIVEVLSLTDEELNEISGKFTQIEAVLKNEKIKALLKSPKYLDFAILALNKSPDDYTNISLTEFKEKLWSSLVCDSTNRTKGFPAKREKAFMEIAINRAKEMKLFTKPTSADEEAIDLLENDEIIFQENQSRKYSPSHDILEDWALVKYVFFMYENYTKPRELFENLGTEPAIRRAFRLWIEDYLIDDSNKINELIKATFNDNSIEEYWADELLIAVFKSENCSAFFQNFEKQLLDNDAALFKRCIHLITTACKESNLKGNNFSILLPIGSGWQEAISFIRKHLGELKLFTLSICDMLSDWNSRLIFQVSVKEGEVNDVKEIVLQFIQQIESGNEYWQQEYIKVRAKSLISLLLNLATIARSEISELIDRAFEVNEKKNNWKLSFFYEDVIAKCVSGLDNQRLIIELPELVIQTIWREWKLKRRSEISDRRGISAMINTNRLDVDECWGIHNKHSFFPSGIYKTPLYHLLWCHPFIGLKFITEFINYSVDFYLNSACDYKREFDQIEIELNDGTKLKQWGSWELWAAYRGSAVTHYAIESLLMSLEKYLLEIAERKTEHSKNNLKFMFNYLLLNSNNVSITSVLASVSIAFPEEVDESMLPLLSIEEFYEWDLNRALQESTTFAPEDSRIPFAQEERLKSNQLPHRKKYIRGLGDFVVDYQFNVRKLNKEIHHLFDNLQTKRAEEDIVWKKRLTEIDVRKWEVKEFDEKVGGYMIQPKYEEDVAEMINTNEDYFTTQNTSINYSSIISKAYEGKEQITFQTWRDCYNHYSIGEMANAFYDRPVSLAVLGLKNFIYDLSIIEKSWCLKTIINSLEIILQDKYSGLDGGFNLLEKEITMTSIHLIIDNSESIYQKSEIIQMIIYLLFKHISEHEVKKVTGYVRDVFFKEHPEEGKQIWIGLIRLAQYRKSNPYVNDFNDPAIYKENIDREMELVQYLSTNNKTELNINEISLENYQGSIIVRALMITPFWDTNDNTYTNFIKHVIPLITEDLNLDEFNSYTSNSGRQINYSLVLKISHYFTQLLLTSDNTLSKDVSDMLLNSIFNHTNRRLRYGRDELLDFLKNIFESLIYKLDQTIANSNDEVYNGIIINKFWKLWKHLFERIKNSDALHLLSTLFLDINWRKDASNWKPLENEKDFYFEMVKDIGKYKTQSIVNLFSTVGERTFLPEGICCLVEIYKKEVNTTVSLMSPSAERMIKRLFYNHISTIKSNKILIDDFIWILNRMIDLGSSEAYLFRENVITYKKVV